jgi:membrane fusion protein (multidrug efflux system)
LFDRFARIKISKTPVRLDPAAPHSLRPALDEPADTRPVDRRTRTRRSIVFIVVLLVFVGLTAGLAYFQFAVKPQIVKAIIAEIGSAPVTVAVTEARTESWVTRLPAIGTFRAFQGIDIAPQIGGKVTAVHVDSGQDVAKGKLLFEIDHSVEEADLASNLATLKNTVLTLERQQKLTVSGNTAKANVDSAEAARNSAAAAVARVRATIDQKMLVAPFAGRLGIRRIDLGQYVSPGTSLVTLQQLDPIYLDFPLPEKWLDLLKEGQPIEVAVDAYPGRTFRGTIAAIDARVATDSRNVWVRGVFDNKATQLLPGMFANLDVVAGAPVETVTLPRTAINSSLYGDNVYVVKPVPAEAGSASNAADPVSGSLAVERRFVRVGETRDERIAILDGVRPGEKVVTEGQVKLTPDAKVRISPAAPLAPLPERPKG